MVDFCCGISYDSSVSLVSFWRNQPVFIFKVPDLPKLDVNQSPINLCKALAIRPSQRELICFVGAGGKTTAMFRLARELKDGGKAVLVTTTTAIFYPGTDTCDRVILTGDQDVGIFSEAVPASIVCAGNQRTAENKLAGLDKNFVDTLYQACLFDCILVEGDGSKRRPIKAPASYEPVIPGRTTKVVGVIGLDSLGKDIGETYVHRPVLFCAITGKALGERITEEDVVKLIASPAGLFKAVPPGSQKYVLLNKVAGHQEQSTLQIIAAAKQQNTEIAGFIVVNCADVPGSQP